MVARNGIELAQGSEDKVGRVGVMASLALARVELSQHRRHGFIERTGTLLPGPIEQLSPEQRLA